MKIGASEVSTMHFGGSPVVAAYLGATQVFSGGAVFLLLIEFDLNQSLVATVGENATIYRNSTASDDDGAGVVTEYAVSTARFRPGSGLLVEGDGVSFIPEPYNFGDGMFWTTTGSGTLTYPQGVSPASTDCCLMAPDSASTFGVTATVTPSSTYVQHVFSVWAKAATGSGMFSLTSSETSPHAFVASSTWQRFWFSFTDSGAAIAVGILVDDADNPDGIEIWGAQFETSAGSPYPTSFITQFDGMSTYSRSADVVTITIPVGVTSIFVNAFAPDGTYISNGEIAGLSAGPYVLETGYRYIAVSDLPIA